MAIRSSRELPSSWSDARLAIAIVTLALLLRIAVVGATWNYTPVYDAADYHRHGVSIADGHGYPPSILASGEGPSALRPPAYPYFLGSLYAVVGPKVNAARLVQAGIGALSVALIGLIGLRIWGRRVAIVSLLIAAVYPPLLITGESLMSEPLFVFFVLGAIAAALEHGRSEHRYRWALVAGAGVGLAALTRSNGIVILPAILLGLWVESPRLSRRALVPPAACLLALVVVTTPWTIRNAVVLHAFVPFNTQTGYAIAGIFNDTSLNDETDPAAWRPPEFLPEYRDVFGKDSDVREVEMDRRLRSRALDFMADHPFYVLEAGFWNSVRMLQLSGFGDGRDAARGIGFGPRWADLGTVSFWILALIALAGMATKRARDGPPFFWLTGLLIWASVAFIFGSFRYRAPVEPFVVILAALALVTAWEGLLRRLAAGRPVSRAAR
jgi:4-amino-4-deoxy-L-arabinose transferase-like glycosyltransferase